MLLSEFGINMYNILDSSEDGVCTNNYGVVFIAIDVTRIALDLGATTPIVKLTCKVFLHFTKNPSHILTEHLNSFKLVLPNGKYLAGPILTYHELDLVLLSPTFFQAHMITAHLQ